MGFRVLGLGVVIPLRVIVISIGIIVGYVCFFGVLG